MKKSEISDNLKDLHPWIELSRRMASHRKYVTHSVRVRYVYRESREVRHTKLESRVRVWGVTGSTSHKAIESGTCIESHGKYVKQSDRVRCVYGESRKVRHTKLESQVRVWGGLRTFQTFFYF